MNILITGARSGIGYQLAKRLSKNHKVYAGCHTEKEVITANHNNKFKYIKFDITNEKDYKLIEELNIDCLINHAGICSGGSLLDLPIEKVKENFEVNVFSTLNLTKYFINYKFKNNQKGLILITSSLIDNIPIPFLGSYIATKSSLSILTKVLNKELKLSKSKVKVKLIKPGAYKTGFNQVMIDDIVKSKYFKDNDKNRESLRKLFNLIENKNKKSIVNKMEKAVNSKNSKLTYSAPLLQKLFCKIYNIASL